VVKTSAVLFTQSAATASLRRISHSAAGSTAYVHDNSSGSGVVAYIVDTGILTTHLV
jgi:hypothetical protein